MRTNNGQILYIPKIGQRADFQHPLMRGCVGWWPLTDGGGGIAKDIVGTNDGVQSGGVTWADTKKGRAASFDGTDDYIDCTALGNVAITGSFSLSIWCNPDTASKDQRFFTKWQIGAGGTSPDLFNIWYDIGGAGIGYTFVVKQADQLVQYFAGVNENSGGVGQWSCVVGVYDITGPTISIYVDGILIESATGPAAIAWNPNDNESPVRIGAINAERADGLAQNARIWNRALSESEILELYTNPWAGLSMPSATRYFFVPQLITASPKLFSVSGSSVSMRSNVGRVSVRAAR